jgi:hypothetical protein
MKTDYPYCINKGNSIEFLNGNFVSLPKEYKKKSHSAILLKFYQEILNKDIGMVKTGIDPIGFNYVVNGNSCNVGLLFEGNKSKLFNDNRKKYPHNKFEKCYILNQIENERKLENYEDYIPIEIVTQNIHEIRNLNSKISAHIDELLNAKDETSWEETFDKADENIKKIYVASRLIKFILDIVRFNVPNHIENIKINRDRSFVIHKSITKIVKIFSNDFKKRRPNIGFEGNSFKKLIGDKELFEIVLMLLVENAIKYSNDILGMPPKVSIRNEFKKVIITISSFGILIPEQMAKQKKEIKEKAIEVTLWEAANKLRGSVRASRIQTRCIRTDFLKVCQRQV